MESLHQIIVLILFTPKTQVHLSCFALFNYIFYTPHLCLKFFTNSCTCTESDVLYHSNLLCRNIIPCCLRNQRVTPGCNHPLSYSYLPHRYPSHTFHLWSPPQPEGVAKPRGRKPPRRAEELFSRPIPPIVPTSRHIVPLWVAIDLYLS